MQPHGNPRPPSHHPQPHTLHGGAPPRHPPQLLTMDRSLGDTLDFFHTFAGNDTPTGISGTAAPVFPPAVGGRGAGGGVGDATGGGGFQGGTGRPLGLGNVEGSGVGRSGISISSQVGLPPRIAGHHHGRFLGDPTSASSQGSGIGGFGGLGAGRGLDSAGPGMGIRLNSGDEPALLIRLADETPNSGTASVLSPPPGSSSAGPDGEHLLSTDTNQALTVGTLLPIATKVLSPLIRKIRQRDVGKLHLLWVRVSKKVLLLRFVLRQIREILVSMRELAKSPDPQARTRTPGAPGRSRRGVAQHHHQQQQQGAELGLLGRLLEFLDIRRRGEKRLAAFEGLKAALKVPSSVVSSGSKIDVESLLRDIQLRVNSVISLLLRDPTKRETELLQVTPDESQKDDTTMGSASYQFGSNSPSPRSEAFTMFSGCLYVRIDPNSSDRNGLVDVDKVRQNQLLSQLFLSGKETLLRKALVRSMLHQFLMNFCKPALRELGVTFVKDERMDTAEDGQGSESSPDQIAIPDDVEISVSLSGQLNLWYCFPPLALPSWFVRAALVPVLQRLEYKDEAGRRTSEQPPPDAPSAAFATPRTNLFRAFGGLEVEGMLGESGGVLSSIDVKWHMLRLGMDLRGVIDAVYSRCCLRSDHVSGTPPTYLFFSKFDDTTNPGIMARRVPLVSFSDLDVARMAIARHRLVSELFRSAFLPNYTFARPYDRQTSPGQAPLESISTRIEVQVIPPCLINLMIFFPVGANPELVRTPWVLSINVLRTADGVRIDEKEGRLIGDAKSCAEEIVLESRSLPVLVHFLTTRIVSQEAEKGDEAEEDGQEDAEMQE